MQPHSSNATQVGIPPYVVIPPVGLTQAPENLVVARFRSAWKPIFRLTMLSIICSLLAQAFVMVPLGLAIGEALLSYIGMICSLPLLLIFVLMRRPKLAHIIAADPHPAGSYMHPLPNNRTLRTTVPTKMRRHLIRDSGVFDIPPTKVLWLIFSIGLVTAFILAISLSSASSGIQGIGLLFSVILGLPLLFIGFSFPVFAWWSYSSRKLGMMTMQHEAESALTAGMLSTIPAIIINSMIFPMLLSLFGIIDDWTIIDGGATDLANFLTLAVSAPLGEELCKGVAVVLCARYIDSPRRGFQVGFTVGLGFAIVENFIYILSSFGGGWIGFTLTSLIRGIGSIPGHALWTGLTGLTIGWLLYNNKNLSKSVGEALGAIDEEIHRPDLILLDPKTGLVVSDATGHSRSNEQAVSANQIGFGPGVAGVAGAAGVAGVAGAAGVAGVAGVLSQQTGGQELASQFRQVQTWNYQHKVLSNPAGRLIPLPKTVWAGLAIAILGHATWNGTSFLITVLAQAIGLGTTGVLLVELLWILVMLGGVLGLGWHIIRAVSEQPHLQE